MSLRTAIEDLLSFGELNGLTRPELHAAVEKVRNELAASPSPPSAEPLPDELEKWKAAYHDMELVAADKTLEVIKLEKLLQQPSPPPSDALRERALAYLALAKKATPPPWESVPVMLAGSNETHSWGESDGRLVNGPPQTIERNTLSARWFSRKDDGAFIAAGHEGASIIRTLLAAPSAAATEKTARELELEDVLSSARCIAERNGENTAWDRFSARIARLGISGVTAKVFKVLPSDQAAPSAGSAGQAVEMSPEFTDTSRSALLWVLWHHQGGNSPVGQAVRFALGMGQFQDISDQQIQEAKKWNAVNPEQPVDQQARRLIAEFLAAAELADQDDTDDSEVVARRNRDFFAAAQAVVPALRSLAHPETPNKEPMRGGRRS